MTTPAYRSPDGSPVLGVLLLEAEHSVETVALDDPFGWSPPPGLSTGFFGHPAFWPVPVVFAVAHGANGTTSAQATPAAVQGVVEAIGRLDGRCDLIVGGCGYFGDAWPMLAPGPSTFAVLSALDQLDLILRSTAGPVVVMSASTAAGTRAVSGHPEAARIRVIGLDGRGEWAHFARPDWATASLVTDAGLEAALREVLGRESAPGGALDGAGAVVLECTVLPHHRSVIREYTRAPIVDVEQIVHGLL